MDVYNYYDLAAFTGRQNDLGIDILHTFGQLLAAFGPVLAGPIVGAIVALLGIAVISVANGLYLEEQNRRNIEAAQAAAALEASSSSSSSTNVNPGLYSITCTYTATGLDTSKITSASCIITLPDTTTESLSFSGTDTSVTSTAKYTSGAYMTDVTVITMDGSNQVDWDSDAQSVIIVSNDVTVDHTMTNSGPYKLTCSISATGYDLTVTSGESARTCTVTAVAPSTFTGSPLTLTIPAGMTSVTSEPLFSSGTTVMVDADIDLITSVTWDTDATQVTLTSDSQVDLTLTNSGVSFIFKYKTV